MRCLDNSENSLFDGGEDTSGFNNVLGTNGSPRNVGWVTFSKHDDGLALDPEFAILCLDGSLEASVDGIILEHVDLDICMCF